MFGVPRLKLCYLFGIPIFLDPSLLVLLLIFVYGGGTLFSGILGAVMLLVSITAHELGHALTARSFGYQTNDITLSLLGGCASLISLPRKASQEFLTAVAGPAVSFLIAVASFGMLNFLAQGNVWDEILYNASKWLFSIPNFLFNTQWQLGQANLVPELRYEELFWQFYLLGMMNLMLGFFNLLPGFPMDGGRIFRSAMRLVTTRLRATFIAMVVGRVVAVYFLLRGLCESGWWGVLAGGLVVGLVCAVSHYRSQIMFWISRSGLSGLYFVGTIVFYGLVFYLMRYLGSGNIMMLLIAWMIWREGYREYQQALIEESWSGHWDYSARVSPPPYGGKTEKTEIHRRRD